MRRSKPAFTVIELLLVVSLIILLIALVLPSLSQSRRAARDAICKSNLHQIVQAYGSFKQSATLSRSGEILEAPAWPLTLLDFMSDEQKTVVCPEDDQLGGGGLVGQYWAGRGSGWPNNISGWYNMQAGPLHRKLSQTQYDELISLYGDNDGAWRGFWLPGGEYEQMGGYQDDGGTTLWLVTEDVITAGGQPGGDKDFNDVQIKLEFQPDGSILLSSKKASGGRFWLAHTEEKENVFPNETNNGELQWSWYGPLRLETGVASYGMNTHVGRIEGDKILMIDYEKTAVLPDPVLGDDWNDYRDEVTDMLTFGRHPNDRVNVLTTSGAVMARDPELLDPAFEEVRLREWEP